MREVRRKQPNRRRASIAVIVLPSRKCANIALHCDWLDSWLGLMFVIFLLVLKVLCALVGSRTPDVGVFVDTLSGDNIFSDLSIIVGYPRAVGGGGLMFLLNHLH